MMRLNIPAIAAADVPIMPGQVVQGATGRLDIDESATVRLRELMLEQNNPDLKLRIQIRGGGCSGFQYRFELIDEMREDDYLWMQGGACIVVDPLSQQMLDGARLEYFSSPMESGFRLDNPQAKSSCGCGVSFALE